MLGTDPRPRPVRPRAVLPDPLPDEAAIYYRPSGAPRSADGRRARGRRRVRARPGHHAPEPGQVSRLGHRYQQQRWFLDAANTYGQAVLTLAQQLRDVELTSAACTSWREYLENYLQSAEYQQLTAGVADLLDRLREVRYCVHIQGQPGQGHPVRGRERLRRGGRADVRQVCPGRGGRGPHGVPHAGRDGPRRGKILDGVATLFPELFSELDDFRRRYASFADGLVMTFDREVQFYLAYLDYIRPLEAGCRSAIPRSARSASGPGSTTGSTSRWPASCRAKARWSSATACSCDGPERVIVVTGPNQGGKTTFARMFGQLHYLASLGLPVPGRSSSPVRPRPHLHPLRKGRRTSTTCGATSRTSWSHVRRFWPQRPRSDVRSS